MATKIYKLNQSKNSAEFPLYANDGKMKVNYVFKDGNQLTRQPARCTLTNEFYQSLLENCDLFKSGVISLERTIDDGGKKEVKGNTPKKNLVEEVTSPEQAIEYCFNTWGVVLKSGKQAVKIASQKGVEFPNLKEKNNDK
jgi:hypothetical protein